MKNTKILYLSKLLIIALVTMILASCSQRITDFTIISSKNVDLSRAAEFTRSSTRISGQDKKHIIIFVPTGIPHIKEAVDKAIESTPGAVALTDGVITSHSWWIPYIYGQNWIEVEGNALIDPAIQKSTK